MRPWRALAPWLLLVPSLALNATFLAGYWRGRMQAARAESGGGRDVVAEQLHLDTSQRRALDASAAELKPHGDQAAARSATLLREFWDAFATQRPDADRLAALLEQLEQTRAEYRRQVLGAALEFQQALSPEQRARFQELLRRHDPAGLRGRPRSPRAP